MPDRCIFGRMAKPARGSAVDDLLLLLDKVPDVPTLELLLQPEHLLTLLRLQGVSDDDIRRDLTQGKRRPGELLLDVLAREPDTKVLLGQLGNPPLPAAPAPRPTPSPGSPGQAQKGGTKRPSGAPPGAAPVPRIFAGLVLAVPSGYYLFVRLDFFHVPTLMFHFPGAYTLLFSAFFGGLILIAHSVRRLLRGEA